jgi:hypothetical protein
MKSTMSCRLARRQNATRRDARCMRSGRSIKQKSPKRSNEAREVSLRPQTITLFMPSSPRL